MAKRSAMNFQRCGTSIVLALVLGGVAAVGQVPATAAGTGSVTGHVMCGDTQLAARFATVMLLAVPTSVTPAADPNAKQDTAAMVASMKTAMSGLNIVQTQTGIDGSFAAANVAPGDYYVFASVPGYVQPMNLVQSMQDAGADLSKPLAGVPVVHVLAERSVAAEVTAVRGAAVSGKVLWDDGSPVPRVVVTVEASGPDGPLKTVAKALPPQFGMLAMAGGLGGGGVLSITDDLGHFRIAGLAAGSYIVKATLQVHSAFSMQAGAMDMAGMMAVKPLVIYAPAGMHKTEAKPVKVGTGDELSDEEVTINLAGMHTVSGRVSSAEDQHGINSATVELTDGSDKDLVRSASVDASGNFAVTFVPPGTYSLTVTDAEDTAPSKKASTGLIKFTTPETLRSYEDGKLSVIVTDKDGVGQNVALTPSKTTKKSLDMNDLLKQ